MSSENSKTFEPSRLLLNLTDKMDLIRSDKYIALSNLGLHYTWKNFKKSYNNNKFKISAPKRNGKIDLPIGSYSISDIQDYVKCIIKKHGTLTYNPAIRVHVNKIKNVYNYIFMSTITFRIKMAYSLELLTLEAMKLLGGTKVK